MDDLKRRIERIEELRESDRREAQTLRHNYKNEIAEAINRIHLRILAMEKSPPEIGWLKYALGVAGAAIAFLLALTMGKK